MLRRFMIFRTPPAIRYNREFFPVLIQDPTFQPDRSMYIPIYSGQIFEENFEDVCDRLFYMTSQDCENSIIKGFAGNDMNSGDIVGVQNDNGEMKYFMCASFGWYEMEWE